MQAESRLDRWSTAFPFCCKGCEGVRDFISQSSVRALTIWTVRASLLLWAVRAYGRLALLFVSGCSWVHSIEFHLELAFNICAVLISWRVRLNLCFSCTARLLQLNVESSSSLLILGGSVDNSAPTTQPVSRCLTRWLQGSVLDFGKLLTRHSLCI